MHFAYRDEKNDDDDADDRRCDEIHESSLTRWISLVFFTYLARPRGIVDVGQRKRR